MSGDARPDRLRLRGREGPVEAHGHVRGPDERQVRLPVDVREEEMPRKMSISSRDTNVLKKQRLNVALRQERRIESRRTVPAAAKPDLRGVRREDVKPDRDTMPAHMILIEHHRTRFKTVMLLTLRGLFNGA